MEIDKHRNLVNRQKAHMTIEEHKEYDKKWREEHKEELKEYWEVIKEEYFKENMREERNQLLQASDFCALPDYPQRDKWIVYRHNLRTLPETWSESNPAFPSPPE